MGEREVDVAYISWQSQSGRSGGSQIALRCSRSYGESHWTTQTFGEIPDYKVTDIRPLVVIDPEDAEAVGRLIALLRKHYEETGGANQHVQAALREFANPKPQIDEPTGWLAVVEDASGDKWVRDGLQHDRSTAGAWWNHSCAARDYVGGELRADFADIDVARIVSEGVQP